MAQHMQPGLPIQHHQQPRVSWSSTPAQSPPAPGSMGPPQRPAPRAKATDINDLSDAVSAAGIDVTEEESYMTDFHAIRPTTTPAATSFNTQSSSTISPENSFGAWGQGTHGGAFQGSGPVSQPAKSPEDLERELVEVKQRAASALNEHRSSHLNDPFLQANSLRHKMQRRAYENGVQLNMEGLYDKIQQEQPHRINGVQGPNGRTFVNGPDGGGLAVVKQAQPSSILHADAPLADILALLSLAANERLRGIMEDSYGLCRNRQISSHGTVPPDFASIAVGVETPKEATVVPQSISGTAWDQPEKSASPSSNPLKRPHPESNSLPTPPTESPPTPQKTVFFPSSLINSLRAIATRDRQYEEARLAKRNKRRKASAATEENAGSPSVADATAAADVAAVSTKLTKKERDRIAKSNQTEEVLHREANKTASLALGGGGKKYSWMMGGAGARGGASTPKVSTPVNRAVASGTPGEKGVQGKDRRYGDFREDTAKGKGIQLRDLLSVLEMDGKEKKTLVRAYTRLKNSDST